MTEEIEQKLSKAKSELPEGFEIVNSEDLKRILAERRTCLNLLRKIQPMLAMAAPGADGDIMSSLQSAIPLLMQLKGDKELEANVQQVIALINA